MAEKVKLTPPMTDSKTPEWVETFAGDLALNYVDWLGRDKVDPDAEHVLSVSISQALLSAYERGKAEREWQPIETAPNDGTLFLAARDDEWVTMVRWLVDEEAFYEVNNDPSDSWGFGPALPTHWMPLPAPPAIRQLLEVKG
jgi:hypothetical protein